jgi:hypothetical protein
MSLVVIVSRRFRERPAERGPELRRRARFDVASASAGIEPGTAASESLLRSTAARSCDVTDEADELSELRLRERRVSGRAGRAPAKSSEQRPSALEASAEAPALIGLTGSESRASLKLELRLRHPSPKSGETMVSRTRP